MALRIATKANQALTLPVLLSATYVNDSNSAPVIAVEYEDTASLSISDSAAVTELRHDGSTAVTGDVAVVQKLLDLYPRILSGKDGAAVSNPLDVSTTKAPLTCVDRRRNGFHGPLRWHLRTSRRLRNLFKS
jgi:hypothetical protein